MGAGSFASAERLIASQDARTDVDLPEAYSALKHPTNQKQMATDGQGLPQSLNGQHQVWGAPGRLRRATGPQANGLSRAKVSVQRHRYVYTYLVQLTAPRHSGGLPPWGGFTVLQRP